jgi:hypothetical protein
VGARGGVGRRRERSFHQSRAPVGAASATAAFALGYPAFIDELIFVAISQIERNGMKVLARDPRNS